MLQTVLSRLRLTPLGDGLETTRAEGAIIVPARGVRVRCEGPRSDTDGPQTHPLDDLLAGEASSPTPAGERLEA